MTEILYQKINPSLWVGEYGDYLYAFAYSRINDDLQAQDLVQDTFLSALQGMDKFEGRSSERTWLTSILKYKIFELYRRKSMMPFASVNESDSVENDVFFEDEDGHWKKDARPHEFGVNDFSAVESKEFYHSLKQCMQKLPPLWMNIFTLKFMEEECADVICDQLKISASNFWVIIHRSKLNLRACLQKNWV